MNDLSANEVTLLVAGVAVLAGLFGWFGRGVGFLLRRWWTGSAKTERATYLASVAELGAKMRSSGMTLEDVAKLEEILQNPTIQSSSMANEVVEEFADEANEPEAYQSNVAMKARAGSEYEVAKAKLNQALLDLQLLVLPEEWDAIERTQKAWKAYRRSLEDCALVEYSGGTHATLAMMLIGAAETERRTEEIIEQVKERARR